MLPIERVHHDFPPETARILRPEISSPVLPTKSNKNDILTVFSQAPN
jgi:hypothetical protein